MKYTLSELIVALQRVKDAPVHPESMQTGLGQVFLRVDRQDGAVALVKSDIEIRDMGTHVLLITKT